MSKAETEDFAGHLRDWFPSPGELLSFQQQPLDAIKSDCIFVLDANVLLLPYASSSKPFAEIVKLYERLVKEDRLFVPAQAMREFLGLRAKKLGEIAKLLTDYQSQIAIPALPRVPLLLDDVAYIEAQRETKKASELASARNAVSSVIERLKGPIGTDPVSVAYQLLFTGVLLEETEEHFQAACAEMKTRFLQKRPPGFSDVGKPDGGIGDLLIWKSLLRLAADRKCHCVFVSSDRKADWWVQANGAFQPRLELIEEYRAASEGRTLHLALLGDALELAGASSDTVEEVRSIEESEDKERLYALLHRARKIQAEGRSRRSPEYYRARALEIEKKMADGRASQADMETADQFLSLAAHLENRARAASYELANFEQELAAEGLELMRDPVNGDVFGIRSSGSEA